MFFEEVPPQMWKFGQLSYNLHKMKSDYPDLFQKLSKKELLFHPQEENREEYRQKWMQKGVLITEQQLLRETNISANRLFAKLERKALENVFS